MAKSITKDMTEGNPFPLILKFSIPLILGNLFQQLYKFLSAGKLSANDGTGSWIWRTCNAVRNYGADRKRCDVGCYNADIWIQRSLFYRSDGVASGNDCHHYDICDNIEETGETIEKSRKRTGNIG